MGRFRIGIAHSAGWPAFALLIAALAARLLVPAGFMPVATAHGVRLVLCSGHGPMAMPGGHGDPAHRADDRTPCGFSALADAAAGGGAFVTLALVIAFFAARLRIARRNAPARLPARLRPPLRAPPTAFA